MNDSVISEQKKIADEALNINFIDESCAVFKKTAGGFLSMETGSRVYGRVCVCPAFPFTHPDKYLSLRENTSEGREIGIIEDISALGEDTQALLREQISLLCFMPVITKINSVKEKYGHMYFDVETDRGRCKFTVMSSSGDIIILGGKRLILKDVDANRFEIPDISALSAGERQLIEPLL